MWAVLWPKHTWGVLNGASPGVHFIVTNVIERPDPDIRTGGWK